MQNRVPGLLAVLVAGAATTALGQGGYADRMAHEHRNDAPVATAQTTEDPAQPVRAEEVRYATVGADGVIGYLARPAEGEGPWPGVIVIHEWWGLNDNIRAMTRRLAGEGYAALAVDLYGGVRAEGPENARSLMRQALERGAENDANLKQAHAYLTETLRAPRVGVIGWCFGGGYSLQTALLLPDAIDACVIYYGRLETSRPRLQTLRMPLLGVFGGRDRGIPVDDVRVFEKTLNELGKSIEVHVYEDADHAFANPSGTRYQPEAAADAWAKTTAFLARTLK